MTLDTCVNFIFNPYLRQVKIHLENGTVGKNSPCGSERVKGEQGENGTVHRISHMAKEELNGNKGEMALSIKLHMWL